MSRKFFSLLIRKHIQKNLKFVVWLLVRLFGLNARKESVNNLLPYPEGFRDRTARNCSPQNQNHTKRESKVLRFI
jgi:hypothetical protein